MDEIKALVQQKRHRLIVNVSDIHTSFPGSALRFVICLILSTFFLVPDSYFSLVDGYRFRLLWQFCQILGVFRFTDVKLGISIGFTTPVLYLIRN